MFGAQHRNRKLDAPRPTLARDAWLVLAVLGAISAAAISVAWGQPRAIKVLGGADAVKAAVDGAPDVDRSEKAFPGGAPLKTDPELERLLTRAEQFVTEERYDLASVLWQKVLDDTGDTLVTRDGRTYTSLADEVERTVSKLPPAGLKVYRITADGEAQAVLAAAVGEREEEGLAEVVRRFFVSSHGDDAAFKLGCLALDRYDFVGASRLFSKILEQHPDPSVPRGEVLLRLAVASARVGDNIAAGELLGELDKAAGPKPSFRLVSLVRRDLEKAAGSSIAQVGSSQDWPMSLGSPARQGHMKGLSEKFMKSRLTEAWGYEFPLSGTVVAQNRGAFSGEVMIRRVSRGGPQTTVAITSEQLVPRWKGQGWQPAGQLLMAGSKIYYKTNNDLTCWDASATKDDPVWRSAWLNTFELDTYSQMFAQMYQNMGQNPASGGKPGTPAEIMLFGDRIAQSMSMSHGLIYNIEGKRVPRHGGDTSVAQVPRQPQYGVVPRRTRRNWLAAYDAQTGKAKWHRSPSDSEKGDEADLGFLSAPVPYGNLLLVPVTDGGTIWVYGLSRLDGKTVWKSYLCDEPSGGCNPWSPVGVAVDGRDAYVLCGAGVVFSIDAVSGQIRFAIRYRRDGKDNPMARNMGINASMLDLNGWGEDVVIPYGRALVVMASDHDRIFAIDRRSGKLLWDSPRTPFEQATTYCLGVNAGALFVAGKNVVRRYNIASGVLVWEQPIDDSCGRGALTDDAIYMPIGNSIARLSLDKGQITQQVDVSLTSGHPVGNVYSDGQKLWALGANRFYALTDLETRLAVLQQRIAEGDSKAQFDRMLLNYTLKDYDAAVADMLAACSLVEKQQGAPEAADTLFKSMSQIQLAQARPVDVLKIFGDRLIDAQSAVVPLSEDLQKQRGDLVYAALRGVRSQKTVGAAPAILKIVPLLNQDYLLSSAGQALSVTAVAADADSLRAAAEGGPPAVRIVAAETLARLVGDASKDTLKKLLAAEQDTVKLAATRALANLGDRESLAMFVKLLESEDVKVRGKSILALRAFTQQKLPFAAHEPPEARLAAVKGWQEWLAKEGEITALKFPLPDVEPMLGRTLISYYGQNLVLEFDADGKESWRKTGVPNPWACQGLPNGHRLVACYAQNKIIEYDEKGNEFWKKEGLPGNPFSVQRLPDGNTLIACSNAERVIEVRPDGSIAWEASTPGMPRDAQRLEDGRTLVALTNGQKVIEIESSGKVVWSVEQMQGASSVQRLENGNTLITCMNSRKVVEVDRNGKEVWSKVGLQQPFCAQRLQNGNTLIAEQSGVNEYDVKGSPVGKKLGGNQASGVSRF